MVLPEANAFDAWMEALEKRHLATLTFPEVRRAVQALSNYYVGRHAALTRRSLDGAGKRAAFALYYGPLHFLLVEHVVAELAAGDAALSTIVDLGCGTGVAGAAWARACAGQAAVRGFELNDWAAKEARWNLAALGVRGEVQRCDMLNAKFGGRGVGIVAAFSINELPEATRERMLERLRQAVEGGCRLLIVEPIAKTPVPWWSQWLGVFEPYGGREQLWRVPLELPELLRRFDKAARLDHTLLKGRTIFV